MPLLWKLQLPVAKKVSFDVHVWGRGLVRLSLSYSAIFLIGHSRLTKSSGFVS